MIPFINQVVINVVFKKSSPCPWSSRFSLMLSSRSCTALCSTFRSVIHMELILVKGMSLCLVRSFACGCPVCEHHLVKSLSLLHCVAFACLPKISPLYLRGCFRAFCSAPLTCLSVLWTAPHCPECVAS